MGNTLMHRLGSWFERQKRVLPWRDDQAGREPGRDSDEPSLYRVWISEIMLQQTQVATVVPYFERFVARFPDVQALAQASEDEVVRLWAGLGYYSRARNLRKAARKIAEEGFPRDRAGWLEMPGVGEYTAGAILSIALNQPEPILDGNVERVISRLRRVTRQKGDAAYKARLWRLARILVVRGHARGVEPRDLNQALMELGATVCSPRKPRCLLCPVREDCRAFAAGDAESFPPKKAPKQWVQVRERVFCLVDREGRVLLEKRGEGKWRAGLWDFPERMPAGARLGAELGDVETRHVVTRHKITRVTRVARVKEPARGKLRASEPAGEKQRWVRLGGETGLALGSALKRSWQTIRERFPEVER